MSTILEEGNYRVAAQRTSKSIDVPFSHRSEALLSSHDGGENWSLIWQGCGDLGVSADDLTRAANFLEGSRATLEYWLESKSGGYTYFVSKHSYSKTSETFLYVVKIPHENFDLIDYNVVHWALGNIYELELSRIDTGEVLQSEVVYGSEDHIRNNAHQMIDSQKTEERSNTARDQARLYNENAKDVAERFLYETDPDRQKLHVEEMNYWLSKSLACMSSNQPLD